MSRNGLYNTLGALARTAVALVTIKYLIAFSSLEEFGLWTLAAAIIGLAAIAQSAIGITTTVCVARFIRARDDLRLSHALTSICVATLVLALILGLSLFFGAISIVHLLPSLSEPRRALLAMALRSGSVWVGLLALQQVAMGIEQGVQRYGIMNAVMTLQSLVGSAGMIFIARRGGGTVEFVQWQVVVGSVALIVHALISIALLRPYTIRFSWDRSDAVELAVSGGWTFLATAGTVIFGQADRLVVGAILGEATEGVYAAITAMAQQINSLSAMPVQPLLPDVSGLAPENRGSIETVSKIRRALHANAIAALALGAVLFAFSDRIFALMLPGAAVSPAFRTAIVIYSLYSLNATGYYLCLGFHAFRVTAAIVLCSSVAVIGLIAIGAHSGGLVGSVLGNSAYGITWLLTVVSMRAAGITTASWLNWLAGPLLWFVLGLILCSIVPGESWRAIILMCTISAMVGFSELRTAILTTLFKD